LRKLATDLFFSEFQPKNEDSPKPDPIDSYLSYTDADGDTVLITPDDDVTDLVEFLSKKHDGNANHLTEMHLASTVALALGCCTSIPKAYAWGQLVATIAQIYLHPTVLPTLSTIIDFSSTNISPLDSTCHIATIATWADRYKSNMTWSAQLHFIGALDDPSSCAFPGKNGWAGTKRVNVLDGMKNVMASLQ